MSGTSQNLSLNNQKGFYMVLIKIFISLAIAAVVGVVVSSFLTPSLGLPACMVTFCALLKNC